MHRDFVGPGSPFELLFDEAGGSGAGLPPGATAILGGDWRLPEAHTDRPYTYVNFVVSRDGRTSFNLPGRSGGGEISRALAHDRWLMGLLRARADAVLIGAGTLRLERRHRWTPASVFRPDAAAYSALRAAEGRAPAPLLVVLTRTGELDPQIRALSDPAGSVLVASTSQGTARARALLGSQPQIDYMATGEHEPGLAALMRCLRQQHGVRTLLCEGGPQVYGALLAAGLVDEEFVTLSPVIVGSAAPGDQPRPALVEGVAFHPDTPPTSTLLAVRRVGSYLFLRSRYEPRAARRLHRSV